MIFIMVLLGMLLGGVTVAQETPCSEESLELPVERIIAIHDSLDLGIKLQNADFWRLKHESSTLALELINRLIELDDNPYGICDDPNWRRGLEERKEGLDKTLSGQSLAAPGMSELAEFSAPVEICTAGNFSIYRLQEYPGHVSYGNYSRNPLKGTFRVYAVVFDHSLVWESWSTFQPQ